MKQRYAGEARHAILTAIASSQRPKLVVVVDPDIDVRNPDQVEWAIAFRSQPARDVIIIDDLPGGTLDPSIDGTIRWTGEWGPRWASMRHFHSERTNRKPPMSLLATHVGQRSPSTATSSSRLRMCPAGRTMTFPSCRSGADHERCRTHLRPA